MIVCCSKRCDPVFISSDSFKEQEKLFLPNGESYNDVEEKKEKHIYF